MLFPPTFRLKLLEIQAGVDGFMVYDLNLIEPMQKVRSKADKPHCYVIVSDSLLETTVILYHLTAVQAFH